MKYTEEPISRIQVEHVIMALGLDPKQVTSVTITSTLVTAWKYRDGNPELRDLIAVLVIDDEDDEYSDTEDMTAEEFDQRLAEGEPVELRVESRPSRITEEDQGQTSRPVRDDQGHGRQGQEGTAGDGRPRRR